MKPIIIAGPCVIESMECLEQVAQEIVRINGKYDLDIIFKASFDKANRTSITSFRGPGMERGLQMLGDIKEKYGLRLLTDIHESCQAAPVGEVVDVLQIPAFLCRQTDLLVAAAKTGKIVNIKKAQFLSGEDMQYPVQKVREAQASPPALGLSPRPGLSPSPSPVGRVAVGEGSFWEGAPCGSCETHGEVWLTERGNIYGYNNLVVDFRNIPLMQEYVSTVIMDCTHSVQRPGAAGGKTGGNREFVPAMALAAKAFGANGFFFETHPDPDHAKSDGPNMLYLSDLEKVVASLL